MKVERGNPFFALCGLACCLCPRFHTRGISRCSGCGGENFSNLHPTCAVITCNRKHDSVEYCFQCSDYPCARYLTEPEKDSFISYKMVRQNLSEAQTCFTDFEKNLSRRYQLLQELLKSYDDGRSKGLYCLVANEMPLEDFEHLYLKAESIPKEADAKSKARIMKELITDWEKANNYVFGLRK